MDIIKFLSGCFPQQRKVSLPKHSPEKEALLTALVTQPAKLPPKQEELASSILSILLTSDKPNHAVQEYLKITAHATGWTEGIAKRILGGLVAAIDAGAPLGIGMKEAFDKASAAASDFVAEHPVLTTVVVMLVAIGILVILVPWAIEALGFGELGPVEGSFAAAWQATFPDVEAGSFFSYLQRLGMKWGGK